MAASSDSRREVFHIYVCVLWMNLMNIWGKVRVTMRWICLFKLPLQRMAFSLALFQQKQPHKCDVTLLCVGVHVQFVSRDMLATRQHLFVSSALLPWVCIKTLSLFFFFSSSISSPLSVKQCWGHEVGDAVKMMGNSFQSVLFCCPVSLADGYQSVSMTLQDEWQLTGLHLSILALRKWQGRGGVSDTACREWWMMGGWQVAVAAKRQVWLSVRLSLVKHRLQGRCRCCYCL